MNTLVFKNALVRSLILIVIMVGPVFVKSWNDADTDCGVERIQSGDQVLLVDDGCSWKSVWINTLGAFFLALTGRGIVEGLIDSRSSVQRDADLVKAGKGDL